MLGQRSPKDQGVLIEFGRSGERSGVIWVEKRRMALEIDWCNSKGTREKVESEVQTQFVFGKRFVPLAACASGHHLVRYRPLERKDLLLALLLCIQV